jgi:tight adherence protein C
MDPILLTVLTAVAIAVPALILLVRACAQIAPRAAAPARDVRSASWRMVSPAIRLLEPLVAWTVSPAAARSIGLRIARAGWQRDLSPTQFRAVQCWAGLLGLSGTALLAWAVPIGLSVAAILVPLAMAMLLPHQVLRRQARRRFERIRRQLPFLIDLVAMSVESGLPVAAALAQAVERSPSGPLREEFLRALGDIKAGRSRDEALTALSDRVAQPALTQFILALLAIARDGGSVLHLLKTIAEQQRSDRLIRAEHQAMQAPVKLLLPLVVFIFPGTFAILLYPVIARVIVQGGLW